MKQLRLVLFAFAALLSLVVLARPAGAVDNPDYASDPPVVSTPPAAASPAVPNLGVTSRVGTSVASESTSNGGLAFTGTDTLVLVVTGTGLIVVGGLVILARRRSLA